MGLVKLMSDAPSSANGPLYDFTLAGSADEVTPALIKGELDMLRAREPCRRALQ